jgi:hypothetical protein
MNGGELENVMKLGPEADFYPDWRGKLRELSPAPDKKSIIECALKFANTGSRRDYQVLMRGVAAPAIPLSIERLCMEQEALRTALAAIVEGNVTAPQQQVWIALANEVVPLPTFRLIGRALRTEIRYQQFDVSVPISGMLAVVLMWLIDPGESFGARLKQCHYSKCGKFSTAQPTGKQGRWRMRYCDLAATYPDDHMQAAHNARKRPGKRRPKTQVRR